MKKICPPNRFGVLALSLVSFLFLTPAVAFAAAPDGAGPWADEVVSSSQGLMKNGLAVPAARSNPSSALGVAENDTADGSFYSLGFGGNIVLKFTNTQSGGVVVVEATNPNYPLEKASVEVSENGSTWVSAGNVTQDGEVAVPENVCVQYVRIKDASNANDFTDATADAYDVDGVKLTGNECKPKHDGGGSTTVIIRNDSTCIVSQSNTMNVGSVQISKAKTGKNKIKNTTGGNTTITTGKATSKNILTVQGGNNTSEGCCCTGCTQGNVTVTIQGNG